ncbi:MAG: 2-amino-4-hydroxy-6-hydroxymethyldihydropteridine diphosphokinase [Verrucomicrobiota bacterium]
MLTAIALGSNLGDSAALIDSAINQLSKIADSDAPFLRASIHRTKPVGCPPGSPDFLNTVVAFEYSGTALDLLRHTQRIEREFGRTTAEVRNAPRLIDLDIIFFGNEISSIPPLVLPHPRTALRRFVLAPFAEILPGLVLPGQSATVHELLECLREA